MPQGWGVPAATVTEWKLLDLIREVLEEPRGAQASFSSETEPTLWKAIPILECLLSRWETLAKAPRFAAIHPAILKGIEKLKKWYINIKESETYFICLALHPSIKLVYCQENWDKQVFSSRFASLEKTFDSYHSTAPKKFTPSARAMNANDHSTDHSKPFHSYGSSFIISTLSRPASQQDITQDPQKELRDYLESPQDPNATDPVKWWGYHAQQYSTLSRMACDYLAIQGSSVASERAFSSAGITDELCRNHIGNEAFGLVQVLKYAYRTNVLNASDEAAAHEPFQVIEIA
ncbi:hypothetical protein M378DRAFT_19230 [Amanita muscaria Koide BX008]|uniref:HAT C-terminal dimerisation domain-containing protein n=1 Tax=Amanita muscaria (strain Koide BX008) TaxID=946122 RepID=A0A0C2SJI6_AMAMK|nr:hypothetical protein M378DRAFT_19230 [Amanita muscaria Koide BX008]